MRRRHSPGDPCDRARALGSALLDGPISETEQAEMDRHLRSCPPCRQVVDAMRDVTARVRSTPALRPPAPVTVSVTPRRGRRIRALAGVGVAAAVAAALGAVAATPWHRAPAPAPGPHPINIAQRFNFHHPWPLSGPLPDQATRR